jgi:hypothetical protein
MRLDTLYRLFNHAALALSCACLLQSERQFIPVAEMAIMPVIGIVLFAWLIEGRWTMPNGAANLFGVLIGLCGLWWMLLQIYNPSGPIVLPMPTGLVPHLGPIMIALLLVKLFRPRRHADFWALQGIGLLQVALGCVLAADPRFGLLFAGYAVCALTSLALHHATSAESPANGVARAAALRAPAGLYLRRPLLWTPVVGIGACILFLLTPRSNMPVWDPLTRFGIRSASLRAQTGFAEEINLNRTGELELDDEVAFAVTATGSDGQAKTDLPVAQRWRGTVLEIYRDGRWFMSDRSRMSIAFRRFGSGQRRSSERSPEKLPDLGPAQYFLGYQMQPRRSGGLFLAEPILFAGSKSILPVIATDSGQRTPFYEFSGTVLPVSTMPRNEYHYRQVVAPTAAPDRVSAENLIVREYAHELVASPPGDVRVWTLQLLKELVAEKRYGLSPADLDLESMQPNDTGEPIPRSAERIAQALCAYLASSGTFAYTLDLRRQDMEVDPAVDFLLNVRAGHCDRFATSLVLMLRACGIPARVVKGFRGAEHQGDGVYVVRQRYAHSWAEALVPRAASPRLVAQVCGMAGSPRSNLFLTAALVVAPEQVPCDWLTLEPTPENEAPAATSFSLWRWMQHQWQQTDQLWQDLVLNFNAEQQADLWYSFRATPGNLLLRLLIVVVVCAALVWLAYRCLRRIQAWRTNWQAQAAQKKRLAPPAWLERLYALLGRYLGVLPEQGRTPRETAAVAAAALHGHHAAAALSDLPGRVVELYYRFRYGDRPLSDDECRDVEQQLARLEAALSLAGRASDG